MFEWKLKSPSIPSIPFRGSGDVMRMLLSLLTLFWGRPPSMPLQRWTWPVQINSVTEWRLGKFDFRFGKKVISKFVSLHLTSKDWCWRHSNMMAFSVENVRGVRPFRAQIVPQYANWLIIYFLNGACSSHGTENSINLSLQSELQFQQSPVFKVKCILCH